MQPNELKSSLVGVLSFPVTPFNNDLSLNVDGLRANVRWLVDSGIAAFGVACGTGEFTALTLDEYRQVLRAAVEEVGGRLPVVGGVGYGTNLAIEFAQAAEESGADGVLVFPPYLLTPEPDGLAAHVVAVAKSTSLGVVLYHRDNAIYNERAVEQIVETCPNVIGFKDGFGSLDVFGKLRRRFGERLVWLNGMPTAETVGLPYFAAGAQGYTSAMSNFFPKATMAFYRAYQNGDAAGCESVLNEVLTPLARIRDLRRGYAISYIKAAMNLLGYPAGPVRPPLTNLRASEMAELSDVLKSLSRWKSER
jgi:5-dehydro-4-deoxyglucarate dehydratase